MEDYTIGGGAPQQPGVKLENTTAVTNFDGGVLFQEGVILRKVSKFLVGTDEDGIIPLMVYFDPISKKILKETLPKVLWDEYKDHLIDA